MDCRSVHQRRHLAISGFSYGIYSNASLSLNATNNTIDNIQYSGIYAYGDNFDKIVGNNLKDCGKSIGAYAVVYLNPASGIHGANDFTVTTNTYTAKQTPHFSYFVYVNADRRYTKIQGNTTNTMLPNYPQ